MKKKYVDAPVGKIRVVKDFLPKPKDLVLKKKNTKITSCKTSQTLSKDDSH